MIVSFAAGLGFPVTFFENPIDKPLGLVYNVLRSVGNDLNKREWRNWQTRTFEGRVVHTVRVQVPFLAPQSPFTVSVDGFCFSLGRFSHNPRRQSKRALFFFFLPTVIYPQGEKLILLLPRDLFPKRSSSGGFSRSQKTP